MGWLTTYILYCKLSESFVFNKVSQSIFIPHFDYFVSKKKLLFLLPTRQWHFFYVCVDIHVVKV